MLFRKRITVSHGIDTAEQRKLNGNMINQMALEDEYHLFRSVIVTFLSHGLPSVRDGLS
jgi:hypothetical protein